MNIKEYIQTGIIEFYALGLCSNDEAVEVNALSKDHPEILNEILKVEEALMQYSIEVKVPKAIKNKIQKELSKNFVNEKLNYRKAS